MRADIQISGRLRRCDSYTFAQLAKEVPKVTFYNPSSLSLLGTTLIKGSCHIV